MPPLAGSMLHLTATLFGVVAYWPWMKFLLEKGPKVISQHHRLCKDADRWLLWRAPWLSWAKPWCGRDQQARASETWCGSHFPEVLLLHLHSSVFFLSSAFVLGGWVIMHHSLLSAQIALCWHLCGWKTRSWGSAEGFAKGGKKKRAGDQSEVMRTLPSSLLDKE